MDTQKENKKESQHRLSITLTEVDYQMICNMAKIGYGGQNKPTSIASYLINTALWPGATAQEKAKSNKELKQWIDEQASQ